MEPFFWAGLGLVALVSSDSIWDRSSSLGATGRCRPGFWETPLREGVVALGLLVLLWFPTVRVPRASVSLITRIAAASLAIYLTHWLVFPLLERAPLLYRTPLLALVVSLAVSVVGYELMRVAVKAAKSRSFWSA